MQGCSVDFLETPYLSKKNNKGKLNHSQEKLVTPEVKGMPEKGAIRKLSFSIIKGG